ncbi:NAD-dependent epimerase/dehydratase family protein [bacterium]|nr:NAD-dependent epimerase/dehydratase family protein [bacterium]
MKVLVTGGLGFIGSNLSAKLVEDGHEVKIIDNLLLGRHENVEKIKENITVIEGDVNRREDLDKVGPVDIIFHLAASSSAPMFEKDLKAAYHNNIIGHVSVLEWAKKVGAKKVIYASTSSIYGNNPTPLKESDEVVPPNYYSITKFAQEHTSHVFSRVHGLEIIGFRFMSVYGPNEKTKGQFANLVSQFIWDMVKGKRPILYGDGTQRRDFTYVGDIVQALVLAMNTEKRFGSDVFNIGTNKDYSLLEMVEIINKANGTNIEAELIPNPVKEGYVMTQLASLDKVSAELGYKPTVSLEEGIQTLVDMEKGN